MAIGAFARLAASGLRVVPAHVGGQPALRMHDAADRTVAVWSFVIADGVITTVHGIVNPDKLAHLQPSGHAHDQG